MRPSDVTAQGYEVHYTSSTTVGANAAVQTGTAAAGWVAVSRTGTETTTSQAISGLDNGTPYRGAGARGVHRRKERLDVRHGYAGRLPRVPAAVGAGGPFAASGVPVAGADGGRQRGHGQEADGLGGALACDRPLRHEVR